MEFISFLFYAIALLVASTLFLDSLRRSEFGVLLFISEFLFFVLGACVYPLLYIAGFIDLGASGHSFIQHNREPGVMAALHVLLYSIFSYVGYHLGQKKRVVERSAAVSILYKNFRDTKIVFAALLIFGIFTYILFTSLVGLDVALINASAARAGYMEGFGGNAQYLFLKTLANVSLFAVCFVPALLISKKKVRDWAYLAAYGLLVVFAYLNSISRSLLLSSLLAPYLVSLRYKISFNKFIRVLPVSMLGALILLYGKTFGHYMSGMLGEGRAEIEAYSADNGFLMALFQNVEFAWFSIAAGISHFFEFGPLFPDDVVYSIIGFVPSRILDYIGLGDIYYGTANVRLPCTNSMMFGLSDCTIPPLWLGYSAYVLPLAGAVIFGLVKFYVFGRIERMWILLRDINYSLTWIPYFWFTVASTLFTLIPSAIPQMTFALVLVGGYVIMRSVVIRALR